MPRLKTLNLPCYVDDVVYVVMEGFPIPGRRRVTDIHINNSGVTVTIRNDKTGESTSYQSREFGDKVFTDYLRAYDAARKGGGREI